MSNENENEPHDVHDDEAWAQLLSPGRRELILKTGLTAAALVTVGLPRIARAAPSGMAPVPPPPGKSPWGYETYREATPRPPSVRPGEQQRPSAPRAYTDIKSYHAHVYFDEDTFEKAALIRRWVADRFLGTELLEPAPPTAEAVCSPDRYPKLVGRNPTV